MTAYSKAAKLKAKKAASVAKLEAQWECEAAVEIASQPADDPLATVRQARARHTGRSEDEVMRPIFGEEAGMAIEHVARDSDEASRLWKLFLAFDRAADRYSCYVIGMPRFAKTSKLEFMPERFETRPDDTQDIRTDDEKHRDAVNAQERWQGHLAQLESHERRSIIRASRQQDELFRGGRATVHGRAFVQALRGLRAVVDNSR